MLQKLRKFVSETVSDERFNQINFNYLRIKHGKFPRFLNLDDPTLFSEKVVWLKLNHKYENAHIIADKYAVRSFVKERIGEQVLIPLYLVLDRGDKVNYSSLPNRFVVKPNNASGEIIFVDQTCHDLGEIDKKIEQWFDLDYGKIGHEYQYSLIKPRIIFEMDMSQLNNNVEITDYKFFCFGGRVKMIQIDSGRYLDHRRDFYDTSWRKIDLRILFKNSDGLIERPEKINDMIDIAEALSRDFHFLRVDLYQVDRKVYFGEMTLHPGGGVEPIWPDAYDCILGRDLDIRSLVDARRNARTAMV